MPLPLLALRPGALPTHDDPEGGQRWHYLTPTGEKLDPPAFLYKYENHTDIPDGWWGEAENTVFPSQENPMDRAKMEKVVETMLRRHGYTILVRPEWVKEVDEEEWSMAGELPRATTDQEILWSVVVRATEWPLDGGYVTKGMIGNGWNDEVFVRDPNKYMTAEDAQKAGLKLIRETLQALLAMVPQ